MGRSLVARARALKSGARRRRTALLSVLVPLFMLAGTAVAQAATLKVNTTQDEVTSGDNKCSLREAITAADSPGTPTDCGTADVTGNYVVLGPKTYQLGSSTVSGALNINSIAALTIVGRGPGVTVIAGTSMLMDRLMTITYPASVNITGLTLTGGTAPDGSAASLLSSCTPGASGGAIYNDGAHLVLNLDIVMGNSAGTGGTGTTSSNGCAGGNGGGVYNDVDATVNKTKTKARFHPGDLVVTQSKIIANSAGDGASGEAAQSSGDGGAGGSGGYGGGIANNGGNVQVRQSTILLNSAGNGGQGGDAASGGGNGGAGGQGGDGGGVSSASASVTANTLPGPTIRTFPGSLSVNNSTFTVNSTGDGGNGGAGTGSTGAGGDGGNSGNGGAIAVCDLPSTATPACDSLSNVLNTTIANNGIGQAGTGGSGSSNGQPGTRGDGGGLYVTSTAPANNMGLQNSLLASNDVNNCGPSPTSFSNGGHNLSWPDPTCPAVTNSDPMLKPLNNYGGFTGTIALKRGSAAINRVPAKGAGCPNTDQRGVRRPQGSACDIGAFEFATPKIRIYTPRKGARYKKRSRVLAEFRCSEGGITTPIVFCNGTVANGQRINTRTLGRKAFTVTAKDKAGHKASLTIHYTVVRRR